MRTQEILHDWPAGIPSGPELEAAGAVIGEIRVNVGDIFDPSIPAEDKWLYRTANKLHINTRQPVVRHQLLFKTGEPYVQRLVDETERILRANDYLYDAWIRPVSYDGKTVDSRGAYARYLDAEPRHQFQPPGRREYVVRRTRGKEPARQRAAALLRLDQRRRPRIARFRVLRSALPLDLDPPRRRLQRRRRRQHQGIARRPAVLRARYASCGWWLSVRLDPRRPSLCLRRGSRQVPERRAVRRTQLRVVGRLEGRLGASLDRRRDLPSESLRRSRRREPRRPAAGATSSSRIRGWGST